MLRQSSCLLGVCSVVGLLLLTAAGCFPDFDSLSAERGGGGVKGHNVGGSISGSSGGSKSGSHSGGNDGSGGRGGSSVTAGASAGADSNSAAGEPDSGQAGAPASCADRGLTICADAAVCTNLKLGNADGAGVADCGECGVSCSLDNADRAGCDQGVCAPTCKAGFGDCNAAENGDAGAANDGCETALSTTDDCGACGYACSSSGATSTTCASGRCEPTCAPNYADCNGDDTLQHDDGCEVYFDSLSECSVADCSADRVACDPTQVCNDGSCVAPSGLAALTVPLPADTTSATAAQRFADLFPPSVDLEGATVTVRAFAPGATGGNLVIFVSDVNSGFGTRMITTPLVELSEKWMDISVAVDSAGGDGFNATIVKQLNLEVHAGVGPWTDPTVVYIDGIWASNQAADDTFDSSVGNMVSSAYLTIDGSTLAWVDSIP